MKQTLFLIICFFLLLQPVAAQKTVQGSGFLDDWSVSALLGGSTPSAHSAFWKNMRPAYGLEMTKYIVPEFGIGMQFLTAHNTTESSTVFDATNLMVLGNVNLSNLMASYQGRPRSFELEAVIGAGWGHRFYNTSRGEDYNFMTTKLGLNLNFFIDKKHYAWAVSVRPALVYNMDNGHSQPTFNVNNSKMEFLVGLTYHFKNANNGKHHFSLQRAYDPTEIDALNAKVNGLQQIVAERDKEMERAKKEIQRLEKQLKTHCE